MALTLDKITEAFKQDIAAVLERKPLNVYEFRHIQRIATAAALLCDGFSVDQISARAQCFRSTENVAPRTHALLQHEVIDGSPILEARYDDLKELHMRLSLAAAELDERENTLAAQERALERDGAALFLQHRVLVAEQKRLALAGGVVPAMPLLPSASADETKKEKTDDYA